MSSLDIHTRSLLRADGSTKEGAFVRCPSTRVWLPLGACRACTSCEHLATPAREAAVAKELNGRYLAEDWLLECEHAPPARHTSLLTRNGERRQGALALARRTPVSEVMEPA